jgi:hypothetical protein
LGKNGLAANRAQDLPKQDAVKELAGSQFHTMYTEEMYSNVSKNVVDALWQQRASSDYVNKTKLMISFVDVESSRKHNLNKVDGGLCQVKSLAAADPPPSFKYM